MAETEPQAGDTGPPKGMPALKAHVTANKIDVALWAIRVLTVLFTIGYVLPLLNRLVYLLNFEFILNLLTIEFHLLHFYLVNSK